MNILIIFRDCQLKAYVSLHTAPPHFQIEHEISYSRYKRMEIEFDGIFATQAKLTFPVIDEDTDEVIAWIAIGAHEKGQTHHHH